MKKHFLKPLLAIACLLCSIGLFAHDFEVDGIYYNMLSSTEVAVTYKGATCNSYSYEYTGSVVIPERVTYKVTTYSVTSIGDDAFYGCTGLKEVTIPNSVTSIGESAFYGCTGLTEITIPNSVTSIGSSAFSGCTGLKEITIPNSVTSIGKNAFWNCYGLTEVTIGNNVTSIGNLAFSDCTGLTEITIPNSVTSIGNGAFSGCTGLTEITIPNSVTSIGSSAFSGCTGLTTVNFNADNCTTKCSPYDVDAVFNGCNNLTTINIGDKVKAIPNYAFSGCAGLKEVTIPNSVTSIGKDAFSGCEALRTVTIGSGVTEIGDYAFDKCDRIKEVYAYPTVPPTIGSQTFTVYVNDNATLHVPESCKAIYENTDYWEYFINVSEDLTYTAIEDVTCDNIDTPIEYYDLNGFRVNNPTRGIYIMKQGNTVRKVVL